MKYLLLIIPFLYTTMSMSQNVDRLMNEQCDCVQKIKTELTLEEQYNVLMECAFTTYKNNKEITDKLVKAYTNKEVINGKDVFRYHQETFSVYMRKKCHYYDKIMINVLKKGEK